MKIFFIGWNDNGEKCLNILLKNKFNVSRVVIPEGYDTEGMVQISEKNGLNVVEVGQDVEVLRNLVKKDKPDLIVVASFPKLIPPDIIESPKYGSINVHAALLPKYRGYHPLNWAIIKDEAFIGVSVHYIDKGMDSGPIIVQGTVAVTNFDDVLSLRSKLTTLGATLLLRSVKKIASSAGKVKTIPQKDTEASFAPKRRPEDGKIGWWQNSREIFNLIRALKSPYPNAFSFNSKGEKIYFEKSFVSKKPGLVLGKIKNCYLVATGDGVVMVKVDKNLKIGEVLK